MKTGFIILIFFMFIIAGCSEQKESGMTAEDSIKVQLQIEIDSLEKAAERKPVTYSFYDGDIKKDNLINDFGEEGFKLILALNRIDSGHLWKVDTLVVPDTLMDDMRLYSPFPFEIPEAYEVEKLFFISQAIQAFAAYEFGNLVKWGPASTGKRSTPTPNGLFHTNWKSKETISTVNDEWILKWNFNISNFEGISIHQYDLPGYPASHACARLYAEDAEWNYYWSQQWILTPDGKSIIAYGTPVILFGKYDYNSPRIWRKIVDEPELAKVSSEAISELMEKYIHLIYMRQDQRVSILAQMDSVKKAKAEEVVLEGVKKGNN